MSNRIYSKADVTCTTEAAAHEDGPSAFKRTHTQDHTTAATRADAVQTELPDVLRSREGGEVYDSHHADTMSGKKDVKRSHGTASITQSWSHEALRVLCRSAEDEGKRSKCKLDQVHDIGLLPSVLE